MCVKNRSNRLLSAVPKIIRVCIVNLASSVSVDVKKHGTSVHRNKKNYGVNKYDDKGRKKEHQPVHLARCTRTGVLIPLMCVDNLCEKPHHRSPKHWKDNCPGGVVTPDFKCRGFLGLKFSTPGYFWVRKFGKHFFGWLDLSREWVLPDI